MKIDDWQFIVHMAKQVAILIILTSVTFGVASLLPPVLLLIIVAPAMFGIALQYLAEDVIINRAGFGPFNRYVLGGGMSGFFFYLWYVSTARLGKWAATGVLETPGKSNWLLYSQDFMPWFMLGIVAGVVLLGCLSLLSHKLGKRVCEI
jgi:hypothetical protein